MDTRMLLSEYDNFGAATGSLDLQTCTATPTGGYAFSINGVDNTTAENQLVIGGVLNFSGTALNTTNSVFDLNDGSGMTLLAQTFSGGSISAPDPCGRIVISLTPNSSTVGTVGLTGYVLDGHTIQLLESQTDTPQWRPWRNSPCAGIQRRAVQRKQCRQLYLRAR